MADARSVTRFTQHARRRRSPGPFVRRLGTTVINRMLRLTLGFQGSDTHGLKAFHRAGQTFLWWNEVDPLIRQEKATWGQFMRALANAKEPCTYRVYAHSRPINAAGAKACSNPAGESSPWSRE